MRVYGNSIMAPTYATPKYNGTIQVGNTSNWCGRLEYNAANQTELRLDNTYHDSNVNGAVTTFGMRAYSSTTRLPVLRLVASGAVEATSAASTNLKQVARISDYTLNGNGSATSFTVTHNLGTADIVVSVRSRTPPYEQVECHVLCNGDATTTANDPTNKCTIVFATAPANNATGQYKVTVIG